MAPNEIAHHPGRSHPPSLLRLAERIVRDERLIERGDVVLCACSGGPDSTALLHVLGRLRARLGFEVVAHGVDHGLRPEAAEELAIARTVADSLGVPFGVTRVHVEKGGNLQARARDARRDALRQAALAAGARRIATGHTADDRAETFLLRLLRGAGPHGLAVMPPCAPLEADAAPGTAEAGAPHDATRDRAGTAPDAEHRGATADNAPPEHPGVPHPPQKTGQTSALPRDRAPARPHEQATARLHQQAHGLVLIRPLLLARRGDVLAHLGRHGVAFARDPSNEDARFLRVRVRNELVPLLQDMAPGIVEHLCALAGMLAEDLRPESESLRGLGRAQRLAVARAKKCERPVKLRLSRGRDVEVGFSDGQAVLIQQVPRRGP